MNILKQNKKHFILLTIIYLTFFSFIVIIPFLYNILSNPNYSEPFVKYLNALTSKWDVTHYILLAKNGYVTKGDAKYALVFFPLYPAVIKVVHTITSLSYELSASIISIISGFLSIFALYRLVRIDFDEAVSFNITKYYIIFPFSFFLITRMSESLFLLLLFVTLFFIRKKQYILAGVLGYLLALTRLMGLAVGVVMLVEFIESVVLSLKDKTFKLKQLFLPLIMLFLTLGGFLSYLGINYKLYGDPFKFLSFQEKIWFQHFENPIYTLNIIINQQLLSKSRLGFKIGVGATNLIAFYLILFVFIYSLRKFRLSYPIYTFIYFYISFSASWLLSGARYSLGVFTIYIVLGNICTSRKWLNILLTIISIILSAICIILYYKGCIY